MKTVQVKKGIHKYSDQPRCYYLGERNQNRFIYKYLDLEAVIISLATNSIRFVEPDQWEERAVSAMLPLTRRHGNCTHTLKRVWERVA